MAFTLHAGRALRCHHCGAREPAAETCPACGSAELARIGAGTQRLERELEKHVPELERIRLDADAVAKPEELREALERFARAERAVLVGTQMVAKGHHFTGVELAAVVDADTGLGLPDFRAEERTFQLLTQLAGRSGRDAPGRVLVQTFQPDSRAVEHAARHDVAGFLAGELERRRALGYPPFRHLVRVLVSGPDLADATRALEELKAGLPEFELLGPAPLLRLRGRHRAQLVGKTDRPRALASAGGDAARGRGACDAPRRPHGRRRRRPAERLMQERARTGGCLCGAVRYTVRGEPFHVGRCHCAACRKRSGSTYTIYGRWSSARSRPASTRRRGGQLLPALRLSPVPPRRGRFEIQLGSLDDAPFALRPEAELWIKRREPWIDPLDGASQHRESR